MKKVLFTTALFLTACAVSAQESVVKEAKSAKSDPVKAAQIIEPALVDPSTANDPETWKLAGDFQKAIYDEENMKLYLPGGQADTSKLYNSLGLIGKDLCCIQKTTKIHNDGMGIMKEISVKALAKINLGLDVVRRREDGYHEVKMVMQTIHLFDRLEMKKTAGGITMTTNLSFLPTNENNLVYTAAKLLIDEFQIKDGIDVKLHKHIPVAAGMAGGSTDAAAVLYGMNRMFELGLSKEELMQRGVKIGADVPYCIMRGTALAEGIGEKLTALPPMVKCPVLIAKPQISVSTKFVYENLRLDENTVHPDIDRLVEDIRQKNLAAVTADMGNVLETVTIPNYPVIAEIKEHMMVHGAAGAMMSGSGPTVFGLFDDKEKAVAAYEAMQASGLAKQVYLTSIYNNMR